MISFNSGKRRGKFPDFADCEQLQFQLECRTSRLNLIPTESAKGICNVTQQRNASNPRYRFFQKLETLPCQFGTVESYSCNVSAGPSKTTYKSDAHGLTYGCHHDRNRRCGALRG